MLAPEPCPLDTLETLLEVTSVKCQNLFEILVPGDHKQSDSSLCLHFVFQFFHEPFLSSLILKIPSAGIQPTMGSALLYGISCCLLC